MYIKLMLVLPLAACSSLATFEGGYHQPYDADLAPGHRGAAIDLHFGLGPTEVPAGGEVAIRTKHGSHLGQWAIAVGGFAFTEPNAVGAFGRVGLNLVQLETMSGEFSFGMGSPHVQAGVYFLPEAFGEPRRLSRLGGIIFTISGSTGYDVRFSDVPDSAWWSVTAGLGFMSFWNL